jgi:16S rRNA G527 N7-methylase RsmG
MIKDKIKKYFHSASIPLTEKQADLFALYYTLINENNDDNDLTRIKGEEQYIIKQFLDSVYIS